MKNFPFEEPDAIRRMREMAERFTKPYRDYERMTRTVGAPYEHARPMFEEPASLRELRRHLQIGDELRRFMAPYGEQQSGVAQMPTAFRPRTGAFEELLHVAFQLSAMLAFLAEADNVLKAFSISDIGPDGATVDGEEVSFDNAEQELERVWAATAGLPAADPIAATTTSSPTK